MTDRETHNANLMADQESTERPGKCIWCSLTVAKHQGPYAHNENWSPQTTGRARLHILIGFVRTCAHQGTSKYYEPTQREIPKYCKCNVIS